MNPVLTIRRHRKSECDKPLKPRGGGGGGSDRACFNCGNTG
jgi:cellular nucleic acid-binding protein